MRAEHAIALKRTGELMGEEAGEGFDELVRLADEVEAYEDIHFPMGETLTDVMEDPER